MKIPDQRWPEPPYMRIPEPTLEQIAKRKDEILAEWSKDEARFIETLCDALCMASPAEQDSIAALAHEGRRTAFGKAVLELFDRAWHDEAQQRAKDELTGVV